MSAVGDARKRLEAQHQEHPDPAVRELLTKAREQAWDDGAWATAARWDVAPSRDNPYRGA